MNKNSRAKRKNKAFRESCRTGNKEVISGNNKRNMQMCVVQWSDPETHIRQTKTVHCKITSAKPSFPKPRRDLGDARARQIMAEVAKLKAAEEEAKE